MPTISELSALSALSRLDKFEVERNADNISYSVTASDIANFVKTISNGGFKGTTTKSLDDFAISDVGMWWWNNNSSNPTGLVSGVVEIITFHEISTESVDETFLQRISYKDRVYQRMHGDDGWSVWASLANKNGCAIDYGTSTATTVTFTTGMFTSAPCVIATPINSTTDKTYIINVYGVSAAGFSVQKLSSSLVSVIENTSSTETESSGTTTKTTTTTITRGEWEAANDAPFYWIALSDVGG